MYELPILPYSFEDLEPYIDTHTMGLHYHKHQQNYLNKLNELLIKNNYDFRYNINELICHIDDFPKSDQESILFNLGGVLNHNLYWKSMNPNPEKITGKLKIEIEKKYGSYKNFWNEIKAKALDLKGSGYVFLVLNGDNQLEIINIYNQNLPQSMGYIPLFNIDMWEHAYYLNYENNKNNYLDNFEIIANFKTANHIFNNIINKN